MKPFTTLSQELLADYRIFRLRKDRCRSPRTGGEHDFYVLEADSWVNVVALTPDEQIVLIEQYRFGTGQITLEMPGGLIDPGESPLEAARRELSEETGYHADALSVLGFVEPNPAILNNRCYTVLAEDAEAWFELDAPSPYMLMVANLRAGNLDGYLGPDPFNQRAVFDEVGFIHILSKEIWDGHPCCSFGVPADFVKQNPNTFAALYRAILTAAKMARDPKNRPIMAEVLSPAAYLNQPKTVLEQVLTGKFADGLGSVQNVPTRADFDPFPWYSMAVWILSQMKRWGYIKGDVNYKDIAEKVYLITDARKHMAEIGMTAPKDNYAKFKVMGKEFDPMKADAYVNSFAIRKA